MKIAVCTLYTDNIRNLAVITVDSNKTRYCKKHGYDLLVKTKNFTYKHLGYEKIHIVHSLIKSNEYDWIYWCGCDTMITNFNIKLEDLIDEDYHFIISKDVWDINSDSFLCKSSEQSLRFLQNILDVHDDYIDSDGNAIDFGRVLPDGGKRCWGEQEALIDLYPKYKDIIKIVPQKVLNSYLYEIYPSLRYKNGLDADGNYGSWSDGDFLLHMPAMSNNNRINISLSILDRIIGDENDT